ncbi:MAG: hypothetical protein HY827_05635 [Actinobacteria bacterium]|nr:hypothetical protein [Actinomycetota bacterium]
MHSTTKSQRAFGRLATLFTLTVLFAIGFAVQQASAGTISGSSSAYTFNAVAGGVANTISVASVSSTQISITDSTETLTESSSYCTSSGGVVTCTISSSGATTFAWNLSTTSDTVSIADAVNVADTITPSTGADVVSCGGGKDRVNYSERTAGVRVTPSDSTANDGEIAEFDNVATSCEASNGGSGPDYLLESSDGAAYLDGNAGNDYLIGSPANVSAACTPGTHDGTIFGDAGDDILISLTGGSTLNGNDGNDTVIGSDDTTTGCDSIWGGKGSDTLIGGAGDDRVWDSSGLSGENNFIDPGAGADEWDGGYGNDTVILRDGGGQDYSYSAGCSTGTDVFIGDDVDGSVADCETVVQTP